MGAMVSRSVGRGGGKPEWGCAAAGRAHSSGAAWVFPSRDLVRLQQRPTFPALRAAGNRFPASFSPLPLFTGSDGHNASLPGREL